MPRHRSRTESRDKGAGAAKPDFAGDDPPSPLERFKGLAKRLVNVPRSELEEERQKYVRTRRTPK
jgi:hypothetical protein